MTKFKTCENEECSIVAENPLKIEPEIAPEPEIIPEPEVAPAPVPPKTGIVVDCARLNVRKKPIANAEVVYIIERWAKVIIDEENSTKNFYKVCTEVGVEGYCMKQFIKILA